LTTINQNNIESITVLKDASATAIYGSRASMGNYYYKRKAGDMQVSYNANFKFLKLRIKLMLSSKFRDFEC
jgi:iron complex outermembrane receptor protein